MGCAKITSKGEKTACQLAARIIQYVYLHVDPPGPLKTLLKDQLAYH
jgi:hypothetical protein